MSCPSEPAPFASNVDLYARYRPGYPADQVADLAARVGLAQADTVLDVGCGTGQLTLPLARHAGRVVALDPVPQMLAAGRDAARTAGLNNISWHLADASRVAELAPAGTRLATFAASFHWTDRASVLAALDDALVPDAAVVVLTDDLDAAELPDWDRAITAVREGFGGLDAAPGAITGQAISHRDVLAASAFGQVETTTWSWSRRLTVEEVVGLQLTYSFSSPARLGVRRKEFCARVRAAVLRLHPDGVVTEPIRVEVLIGRRAGR